MDWYEAIKQCETNCTKIVSHACNCIGPQKGQPACPCAMKDVKVVDGRWIRAQDLGPVK